MSKTPPLQNRQGRGTPNSNSKAGPPANDYQSEHDHYGPNWCLEIMTWLEAGFDDHAIRGSLADLKRLADIVDTKLVGAKRGQTISIKDEFVTSTPYVLVLDVREDGFDPADADP